MCVFGYHLYQRDRKEHCVHIHYCVKHNLEENRKKKLFRCDLASDLEVRATSILPILNTEYAGNALGIWICGCSLFY